MEIKERWGKNQLWRMPVAEMREVVIRLGGDPSGMNKSALYAWILEHQAPPPEEVDMGIEVESSDTTEVESSVIPFDCGHCGHYRKITWHINANEAFHIPDYRGGGIKKEGMCRRYPPSTVVKGDMVRSMFPRVEPGWRGCGEWEEPGK